MAPPQSPSPTIAALRAARGAGRRRRRNRAHDRVVAYLRVSGEEQQASGLGLDAQLAAITAECERRGWELVAVERDEAVSGRTYADKRPGLVRAIEALDRGEVGVLMVAKIDRVARSITDLAKLDQLGELAGWHVVALNVPFDTTTVAGRQMRNRMSEFAELEAAMGSERMKAAHAVRRARGDQLGRPSQVPAAVRERIGAMVAEGLGWSAIARILNAEGVPTSKGGRWYPATVQRLSGVALPRRETDDGAERSA